MTTNGIYSISDLLAVRNASAASYGIETIWRTVQMETEYANKRVNEMLADFCMPVTAQSAIWGGGGTVAMDEVDEYGVPMAKQNAIGITAQFPLRMYKQQLGWTEEYFETATPAEVAEKFLELRKGYFAQITKQMKKSLYLSSVISFVDRLTNGVTLSVKPLQAGDITVGTVPDSPAGVVFANTHTHILAENVVSAADVQALVDTVTEHGNTKGLKIFMNAADKAAFIALTGFTPLSQIYINYDGVNSTVKKLDNEDVENQLIGYWLGGIECWVKPWACDNYLLCVATGMPEKVLGYRQRAQSNLQGWRIVNQFNDHPLIAEYAKAEFGFGVFNRVMGAVNYMNNDTWADPTIT